MQIYMVETQCPMQDINGDGISDIIIGSPDSLLINFYSGAAYVVFGSKTK